MTFEEEVALARKRMKGDGGAHSAARCLIRALEILAAERRRKADQEDYNKTQSARLQEEADNRRAALAKSVAEVPLDLDPTHGATVSRVWVAHDGTKQIGFSDGSCIAWAADGRLISRFGPIRAGFTEANNVDTATARVAIARANAPEPRSISHWGLFA